MPMDSMTSNIGNIVTAYERTRNAHTVLHVYYTKGGPCVCMEIVSSSYSVKEGFNRKGYD